MARWHQHTVAVVITVKNDPLGCAITLGALAGQTRNPDEIIVVDGGSNDGTIRVIRQCTAAMPQLRLIEAPGANIARGRNIGTQAANSEIIVTTDSGCRAEPDWVEKLLEPFVQDRDVEFVAGFYQIETQSLLEEVVGLATMRGQLEPVAPETFNPSARSLALTKALWSRAGGWPDWLFFSEDTLFDHKIRRMDVCWRFAGDAVVHWQPRNSLRSIARQFYNYGTGRGHTQIDAGSFIYNLRNVLTLLITAALCLVTKWAIPVFSIIFGYFYIWSFHGKAARITRRTGRRIAYPLCIVVMWVVLFSNLAGYLRGTWQRWRHRQRFRNCMEAYMASP